MTTDTECASFFPDWISARFPTRETGDTSPSSSRESELVEASRNGSHEAYRLLVDLYQDRIFRFCLGWVGNTQDAEEICQDTFVNAFSALPRYRSSGQFSSWLYRIARNNCHDHHRSRRHRNSVKNRPLEPTDADMMVSKGPQPDDCAVNAEEIKQLESGIARLPANLRDVVVLCAIEGMSYAECAAILSCSVRAVEGRLYRARTELETWCAAGHQEN